MALPPTSLHEELASRGLVLLRGSQAHVALAVSMPEPGPGVPRDLPATQSLNPRVLTALAPMLPVMTRLSLIMMIPVLLFETNVKRTTTSRSHPLYLRHVSHVESAFRTKHFLPMGSPLAGSDGLVALSATSASQTTESCTPRQLAISVHLSVLCATTSVPAVKPAKKNSSLAEQSLDTLVAVCRSRCTFR